MHHPSLFADQTAHTVLYRDYFNQRITPNPINLVWRLLSGPYLMHCCPAKNTKDLIVHFESRRVFVVFSAVPSAEP